MPLAFDKKMFVPRGLQEVVDATKRAKLRSPGELEAARTLVNLVWVTGGHPRRIEALFDVANKKRSVQQVGADETAFESACISAMRNRLDLEEVCNGVPEADAEAVLRGFFGLSRSATKCSCLIRFVLVTSR